MVTNYFQQLASAATSPTRTAETTIVERVMSRLGRALCGLSGHDSVLHFEANRVMMRCTSCGYDTPGWEISPRGPRRRYEGDAQRHLIAGDELRLRKTA